MLGVTSSQAHQGSGSRHGRTRGCSGEQCRAQAGRHRQRGSHKHERELVTVQTGGRLAASLGRAVVGTLILLLLTSGCVTVGFNNGGSGSGVPLAKAGNSGSMTNRSRNSPGPICTITGPSARERSSPAVGRGSCRSGPRPGRGGLTTPPAKTGFARSDLLRSVIPAGSSGPLPLHQAATISWIAARAGCATTTEHKPIDAIAATNTRMRLSITPRPSGTTLDPL